MCFNGAADDSLGGAHAEEVRVDGRTVEGRESVESPSVEQNGQVDEVLGGGVADESEFNAADLIRSLGRCSCDG